MYIALSALNSEILIITTIGVTNLKISHLNTQCVHHAAGEDHARREDKVP